MKRGRNETEENKEKNRGEYLRTYVSTYLRTSPLFRVYRHSLGSSSAGIGGCEREQGETSPSSRIALRVVKDE